MLIKNILKFLIAMQLITIAIFTAPSFARETIWVPCGEEGGQECNLNGAADNSAVLVRYGFEDNNNYFFFGVQGQDTTPCSNFNGNPSHGDSKSCWYYADGSFLTKGGWNSERCATEGSVCNVGDNLTWVRYGAGNKWLFTLQSGSFECSDEFFGWDPYQGGPVKECYLRNTAEMPADQVWTTCATERETCNLTTINYNNAGIVIKYGEGDSWTYKVATQGQSFECGNIVFGDPSPQNHKSCAVTPYYMEEIETSGEWVPKIQCSGSHCSNSFSVSLGSEWSNSITNQQTWSVGVTESITEGMEIGPDKVESTQGYSSEYANSTSYQKTMSDSYSETATVDCGTDDENKVVVIYQFSTNSAAACLTGTGQCASTTYTQDFICYIGDVGDDGIVTPTPQCLPNACENADCTVCKSD